MPHPRRPSGPPRSGPRLPAGRVTPGRRAAGEALLAIHAGEHAEDALARFAPSDPGERALAWNLVLGVLRARSALDEGISAAARRAIRNLDPEVATACRVGAYEIRYARVPAYAAVDQAVELVRGLGAPHAAGFVNAVLRRQEALQPSPEAELGHPAWLVARWRARYGAAAADAWMRANNEPAAVCIVAKEDPAGVARDFQHAGLALVPVGDGVFRVPSGSGAVPDLPGFVEGRWWVMDPAAVAVADLVGAVPAGTRVLDACAAPGGKTFRLAAKGLAVTATDVDAARVSRLQDGAARLGLAVEAKVHDHAEAALPERFPVVLVDAPCTSLGVLRRHPDIRWRRSEADVHALAERQAAILAHAAQAVEPGGALVYAVCSPEPEEGPAIVAPLLAAGWTVEARFDNAPALDGADVFQGWRLRAPG